MATIKFGDTQLETALVHMGERLTLTLTDTALPLDELAALFDPGAAPEIRVLDDAGLTTAIYRNHAIVELVVRLEPGDVRRAVVGLQAQPIEQSMAEHLQERVAAQEQAINQLQADSLVKDARIAEQQSTLDNQATSTDERIGAVEAEISAVTTATDELVLVLADMIGGAL